MSTKLRPQTIGVEGLADFSRFVEFFCLPNVYHIFFFVLCSFFF